METESSEPLRAEYEMQYLFDTVMSIKGSVWSIAIRLQHLTSHSENSVQVYLGFN